MAGAFGLIFELFCYHKYLNHRKQMTKMPLDSLLIGILVAMACCR